MATVAVIYARFSPRPDGQEALSNETQIDRCRAYCSAQGYPVAAVYQDRELSGKRADNRPGLQAALAHVCKAEGVLVVYSLSRLSRKTRDAISISEQLARVGAQLASLHEKLDTTSAIGRFFFVVIAALAELEREQISERTTDAMRRHQAAGRRMSDRAPFGWAKDPKNPVLLIKQADEQAVIRRILKYAGEGLSLHEIGRRLEAAGQTCRGNRWYHSTIQKILRRSKSPKAEVPQGTH